jgi:hypothetical protein
VEVFKTLTLLDILQANELILFHFISRNCIKSLKRLSKIYNKIKFVLEQAMKAQKDSSGIALLFL